MLSLSPCVMSLMFPFPVRRQTPNMIQTGHHRAPRTLRLVCTYIIHWRWPNLRVCFLFPEDIPLTILFSFTFPSHRLITAINILTKIFLMSFKVFPFWPACFPFDMIAPFPHLSSHSDACLGARSTHLMDGQPVVLQNSHHDWFSKCVIILLLTFSDSIISSYLSTQVYSCYKIIFIVHSLYFVFP